MIVVKDNECVYGEECLNCNNLILFSEGEIDKLSINGKMERFAECPLCHKPIVIHHSLDGIFDSYKAFVNKYNRAYLMKMRYYYDEE